MALAVRKNIDASRLDDEIRKIVEHVNTLEPADIPAIIAAVATTVEVVAGATYTLSDDDHNKILDFSSGSAVTVTVPTDITLPFCVGISQGGAGQVTLDPDVGVTINEPAGNLATAGQYEMLTLMAFSADSFRLFGNTA